MTNVKSNKETLKILIKSIVTTFKKVINQLNSSSNQLQKNGIESQIVLMIYKFDLLYHQIDMEENYFK